MVIFANTCNTSVGKGHIAGIILCIALCFTNWLFCRKVGYEVEAKCGKAEVWAACKDAFWAILMPVIILGGIMTGYFTLTESAAIATLYGLIIGLFIYRELDLKHLPTLFYKAALNSALIMVLIGYSSPFGYLMTTNKAPQMFSNFILGISKVTMGQISQKVRPFLAVMVACLFLFMAVPGICTFPPDLMFN